MNKKYYELVIEGHYNAIFGLLEGFLLASGRKDWNFFFSNRSGIKTETFMEKLLDFITVKSKMHHVVINEDFYRALEKSIKDNRNSEDEKFVHIKYIKNAAPIKDASFGFLAKTYGKKYGEEIKALLKNLPAGLVLHDFNPIEKVQKDAKGVELYAPDHEYTFEAAGRISGEMKELIEFRHLLDEHPLVEVEDIILVL